MKKTILGILIFLLCGLLFSQEDITGKYVILNPPKDFLGTKQYEIKQKENKEYSIVVNDVFSVRAFYDKENNEMYFVMEGFGPDGPLIKLKLELNQMTVFSLENGKWNQINRYRKQQN
jgi:hypothetical protein